MGFFNSPNSAELVIVESTLLALASGAVWWLVAW